MEGGNSTDPVNGSVNASAPSWTFACFYMFVFMTGLLLNSMAIWVFFQIRMQKRTFMLYLRNMAMADLLMTLTLPVTVLNEAGVGPWWLPAASCRYTAVIFYCCMYVNVLFLGLMAVDRYLKIVRPFGNMCGACLYSYSFTVAMAIIVWLVMVTLSLPNTILTDRPVTPETVQKCPGLKSQLGLMWHKVVIYINTGIFFLVLVTLLNCYIAIFRHIRLSSAQFVTVGAARKPKQGQNILVLLLVFFICFVPYHLWRIPFTQKQTNSLLKPSMKSMLMDGKKATLFLSSCNVCLDPVIYFLMCASFRNKLAQMLGFWIPRHQSSKPSTTSERKKPLVLRFRESSSSS